MSPEISSELERTPKPDVIVDFIRHGQTRYTDEELKTGELEGELTEKGISQIENTAINEIVRGIDRDNELVVMWVSPRGRAKQSAQIIENHLASAGITPIRKSIKQSLSDVKLFGYSEKINEIIQGSNGRYWMDVWRSIENLPKEIESPGDVQKRTNRLIAYLSRIANTVNPEGGKRLHFILIGHEETVQGLLEKSFGIGATEGEGQANSEVVRVGLFKGSKDQNPKLSISFRGNNKKMEFDPGTRKVLA